MYMSQIAESQKILYPGHYGARPDRSSQEALIHLVSWIKAQWRAGRVVGAIFADVKSVFPSVHHPRMIQALEMQGYPPELINVIQSFLSDRKTYLSFNGFDSNPFSLTRGLPQGSPLSPLLYLLYNTSLLSITNTHSFLDSVGFVNDVVVLSAAVTQHELRTKVQHLADEKINWARRHGAISDVTQSKWLIFTQSDINPDLAITFGNRPNLQPESEARWLGVVLDRNLSFKRHRSGAIAKGTKMGHFLSSLSTAKWGIPPHFFEMLITSTAHAATDYAVAVWMSLPIPKNFSEKLVSIDNICATKELGALKDSPAVFLRQDLDLKPPEIRLSAKIINSIAIIALKPPRTTLAFGPCTTSGHTPPQASSPRQTYIGRVDSEVTR